MNQILSVDMPKKVGKMHRDSKKASTKSVVIFFCIVLIVFGIMLIGIGIVSILRNKNSQNSAIANSTDVSGPQIYISQNGTELEVEVSADNEISKVEYKWNDGEVEEKQGDGAKRLTIYVGIPSGANTFNISAIDVNGKTNKVSNEYIGPEGQTAQNQTQSSTQNQNQTPSQNTQTQQDELSIKLEFIQGSNKLKIRCEEQKKIKNIIYYYDNEKEQIKAVNNTTSEIEIPVMQGEHNLTIKVAYEDNTEKKTTKKIFFPVVERVKVSEDGKSFILRASDIRKITKVKMNFNDQDLPEESVNSEKFEKTLQLKEGENRLILTVYNSEGVSITTRTRYEKK